MAIERIGVGTVADCSVPGELKRYALFFEQIRILIPDPDSERALVSA